MCSSSDQRGLALIIALFATTLMLALGGALILLTSSETIIAANFRTNHEALYAADAALERALVDLRWRPAKPWRGHYRGARRSVWTTQCAPGYRGDSCPNGNATRRARRSGFYRCARSFVERRSLTRCADDRRPSRRYYIKPCESLRS